VSVLVDTSVWINYFNLVESPATKALAHLIETKQELFSSPLIAQEILQGLNNEKSAEKFADLLAGLTFISVGLVEAIEAARLFRTLRRKGKTLGTIDAHIAALCKLNDLELLTVDKDFKLISGISFFPLTDKP
jgi:predicted nucleic acid-binding protein